MTQHTPGPWKANETPFSSNHDWVVLDSGTNGHSKRVCAVYSANPEADGRLIAAAPTMYEFVASKAQSGDNEAAKLLEQIHGNA